MVSKGRFHILGVCLISLVFLSGSSAFATVPRVVRLVTCVDIIRSSDGTEIVEPSKALPRTCSKEEFEAQNKAQGLPADEPIGEPIGEPQSRFGPQYICGADYLSGIVVPNL